MKKLMKLNGIGEYEPIACFACGSGAGPDNEKCGMCEEPEKSYQRLGYYEETDLTPDVIINLNDFEHSQCAKILAEKSLLESVITGMDPDFFTRKCRICGCTWNHACVGGCYWVEDDLCSQCSEKEAHSQ